MQLDITKPKNREIGKGDLISIYDIDHLVVYDFDTKNFKLLNIKNMELASGIYSTKEMNESILYKLIAKESELRITDCMGGK
nr:hypothetical protein [Clostridioides sp.]